MQFSACASGGSSRSIVCPAMLGYLKHLGRTCWKHIMLLLAAQSWIWHNSPASGVSQGWHSSTAQAASWLQKYCSWVSKYTENIWRTSDFRMWACVACKINMLFFSNCTAAFQNRSFLSLLLDVVTREELTYTTEGKMLQTSGLLQHNIYVWHLVQGTEVLLPYPVCPG